ncbi:phosphatidylinositol 4-kinase [Suhomyces tanzawaensis NRRL Y-17324]|uniref:1-phosphatidylinositol 4-kinase n=1 Tax=Suhomyces tanzawaensis NRRL Y-17324 TaxID=984487 RepID=A0A1E4SQ66_9ASCO|nr:phosphatidylinositol 4-kinase [Suhomyces tanzawaensis NRRL Y-17324]ODV81639.1 phosphatidylinositol 4-kinase [Suhomyces tanzawaensis NRRL Y-17324]
MSQIDTVSLLKEIRSGDFSAFKCIDHLRRNCDSIGIHHALVKRLYSYTYDELEFFIPQFVQLLVSFDTNSMALEDFLLDYCTKYPHFSLIVFWNLQAYVFELRNDPDSTSFKTVRLFINKLQNILFNTEALNDKHAEFRENLQPSLVMCGAIAASIAIPGLNDYIAPIIKSQGKQQKSFVFKLANFQKSLTKNLTMKNKRLSIEDSGVVSEDETGSQSISRLSRELHQRSSSVPRIAPKKVSLTFLSDDSEVYTTDDENEAGANLLTRAMSTMELKDKSRIQHAKYSEIAENLKINTYIKSKKRGLNPAAKQGISSFRSESIESDTYNFSRSLPDLSKVHERPSLSPTESESIISINNSESTQKIKRNLSQYSKNTNTSSYNSLLKTLQVNYAKKETEFIMALQNISLRLSQVPKEARLSALRAELSIINDTLLPSEIDIPQLLPVTSNKNKKYHKILRLSVNEACVLNSAERVPFLLLVEYLSDESDFNPFSEQNQKIIQAKRSPTTELRKREITNDIIDITEKELKPPTTPTVNQQDLEVLGIQAEADLGDFPILSHKSSAHELSKLKITDSPNILDNEGDHSVLPIITGSSAEMSTKSLADQMRIASVMLQQLDSSGQSSSEQSLSIRSRIVESMISLQDQFDSINFEKLNQLKGDLPDAGERKLENDFKLGEDWNTKKQRIKKSSIYGHLPNWELCSVIAKNGDDLPQEAFACQLITMISNIWKRRRAGAWTKRMKILITSAGTGLVETITNAMSIHSIKKSLTEISIASGENSKGRIFTLQDYFTEIYGSLDSPRYKQAQDNFAVSLASYSILCYILQIKDRHNGNIMVDNEGHIIHIDFGFLLSNSPGSVGFEAAPFKLTSEYVDLLGGQDSAPYKKFVTVCKNCFISLRAESEQIVSIVELMQKDSTLPCFKNGETTSVLLKQRLQLHLTDDEAEAFVENYLIGRSIGSIYTRLYDQFQMITQGIYS